MQSGNSVSTDSESDSDDGVVISSTSPEVQALKDQLEQLKHALSEKQRLIDESQKIQDEKQKLIDAANEKLAKQTEQAKREKEVLNTTLKLAQEEARKLAIDNKTMLEMKIPLAATNTVQRQFQEKIVIAQAIDEKTAKQNELTERQALLLVQQLRFKKLLNRVIPKLAADMKELKKKIAVLRKSFFEKQTQLQKKHLELVKAATPKESIKVRDARAAELKIIMHDQEVENKQYEEALRPLHSEISQLLDQARPLAKRFSDAKLQIRSARVELSKTIDGRNEDAKKLQVTPVDKNSMLRLFGGSRASDLDKKLQQDFFDAFNNGRFLEAATFLKRGARIDALQGSKKMSLLLDALTTGEYFKADQINWLIDHGANPSQRIESSFGLTVDPAIVVPKGATPFILIAQCWHVRGGVVEVMKKLIQKGADINAVDDAGNSAFHYQTAYKNENELDKLAEFGGNKYILNKASKTPYDIARDKSWNYGCSLLQPCGQLNRY